jgi:hypothetical protein
MFYIHLDIHPAVLIVGLVVVAFFVLRKYLFKK